MSKILSRNCDYCGKHYIGQGKHYCSKKCADQSCHKSHSDSITRFWSHVEINDLFDCWNWTACKDRDGYGQFHFKSKQYKAHRVAWILSYGEIPEGLIVCHHCDNPSCINPTHLFLGTHLDNAKDRDLKGRGADHRGNDGIESRLKPEQVIAIRELYQTEKNQSEIARMYKMSHSGIGLIVNRKTWKHI